jgi:hypothetical protein
MVDRFDLEQQILECWKVTDEINLVYEAVMNKEEMTKDDIANLLLGIKSLYDLKFDRTFTTFEELIKEKKLT